MRLIFLLFLSATGLKAQAQDSVFVSQKEVARILGVLASDSLKGRKNHSAELEQAARFIASEFGKDSLLYFFNDTSYFQPFATKRLSKKERLALGTAPYNPRYMLRNVVGVLEGRSKPDELVIFSAHYDHLGTNGRKRGDSIYNGANDNASGTTAVLSLAHYFAQKRNNERTLVFCAFAGEELGLLGSEAFVRNLNPGKIVAVINIEMIGDDNVFGKNSFFVTGSDYSNLLDIFQKNLQVEEFRVHGDPTPNAGCSSGPTTIRLP